MIFRKSKKDILNGNIPEQILIFTIPLVGAYLLQQAYQTVDTIILGRYASKVALAAIGASNSIINVIINIITGMSAGIMIVLAQNMGRRDHQKSKDTVRTGMFIAFVLGGLLTLVITLFARPLLILTSCPEETINDSLIYIRMYGFSFIPYLIVSIGNYTFRAMGENKSSIVLTLIIAISKIVLDILLTAVFKMGIWGVSISTFAAQTICAIVVLILFALSTDFYHFSILDFGCDFKILKETIKIGAPVAIQNMLFAVANLIIQSKINTYGTDTIAAYAAFNSVDNYYWCFANAIASATITLAGQNFGNKNKERVKNIIKHALIIDLLFSMLITICILLFANGLLGMYTTDTNVLTIGHKMMYSVVPFYSTYIFIEIISAGLKACGETTIPMLITLIAVCVVRILYIFLMSFTNCAQVLYCYPISWVIAGIAFVLYYIKFKKQALDNIA